MKFDLDLLAKNTQKIFDDLDIDSILTKMEEEDLNLDKLVHLFDTKFRATLDTHTPLKLLKKKAKDRQPWFNN